MPHAAAHVQDRLPVEGQAQRLQVAHPRPVDGLRGGGVEGLDAARGHAARMLGVERGPMRRVAIAARSQADPIREKPTGTP